MHASNSSIQCSQAVGLCTRAEQWEYAMYTEDNEHVHNLGVCTYQITSSQCMMHAAQCAMAKAAML